MCFCRARTKGATDGHFIIKGLCWKYAQQRKRITTRFGIFFMPLLLLATLTRLSQRCRAMTRWLIGLELVRVLTLQKTMGALSALTF